ncbi:MAG: O-antigen ligase family protein [Leptolyngbyaceae cyanobacterium MAG.088]|nr:O-antigen ligase family protein [Leptolyngbyaceae cyanobacterium MAG.088]
MAQGKFQSLVPIWLIIILGVPLMIVISLMAINSTRNLILASIGLTICYLFFRYFEPTTIALLVLRSALDIFSKQQLPALFAVGVDALVIAYICYLFIARKKINVDRFWWLLMGWFSLQSLWVILLFLGGLGGDPSLIGESLREWVRLSSGGLIYLLVMQLKGRIAPERLINLLFLCVAVPTVLGLLQTLPISLPALISSSTNTGISRVQGSFGHPNRFADFSLLFIALSLWKGEHAKQPRKWYVISALLVFLLLTTKSLTGLVMLAVFLSVYFLPKLKGKNILWVIGIVGVIGVLLATNSLGDRLGELSATPLFNPDIDWQRGIDLQHADSVEYANSFNWRLAHWADLLQRLHWHPWLGYGLATTKSISTFNNTAHNDYVRFLFEGGIIGFIAFLLFLFAQLSRLVQLINVSSPGSPRQRLGITLLAVQVAMLVAMLTGNVMTSTSMLFYWWALLAVLGWQWSEQSHADHKKTAT